MLLRNANVHVSLNVTQACDQVGPRGRVPENGVGARDAVEDLVPEIVPSLVQLVGAIRSGLSPPLSFFGQK